MKKPDTKKISAAQKTALSGMLAAAMLALSFIERLICASLPLPPGVRPGLSNVAVMFTCVTLGLPFALCMIVIKAGFVTLVSGAYAGIISLSGGMLSVLSFYALSKLFSKKLSYTGFSVVSAVMHNTGQMAAASALVGSALYMYLAPALLVSGAAFGVATGALLKVVLPALSKTPLFANKPESQDIDNNISEEKIWEKQDPTRS